MNNAMSNAQVAPHGILGWAIAMLLLIFFVHTLGFRVVGAVRVGK